MINLIYLSQNKLIHSSKCLLIAQRKTENAVSDGCSVIDHEISTAKRTATCVEYPDEAFHMVTQVPWEEDVIWNGEEARTKITSGQRQRGLAAGWVPSSSSRTAEQFIQLGEQF